MSEVDPLTLIQPAATRVRDPVSGRSLFLAGIVQQPTVREDGLHVELVFTPEHSADDRRALGEAFLLNLRELGYQGAVFPKVRVRRPPRGSADPVPGMSGPGLAPHGGPIEKKTIEGVRRVIAVHSAKGGVGKSTIATNLAVGLRQRGLSVGLLDADLHGPSLPTMMNVRQRPLVDDRGRAVPVNAYGVRCMSLGLVADEGQAVIWRGPMVMGVLRQLLQDTAWGELDVLVLDLPPGTGDAQLTVIQAVDLAGAIVVTTPQEVALADARRGLQLFDKLGVPVLGLVENMAWYTLPDGSRDFVFGDAGGVRLAEAVDVPLLAQIPLNTSVRKGGDAGLPAVLGDGPAAQAFRALAEAVAGLLEPAD